MSRTSQQNFGIKSSVYILTHQAVIVRLDCSTTAGEILLQLIFGLNITVLLHIDGH